MPIVPKSDQDQLLVQRIVQRVAQRAPKFWGDFTDYELVSTTSDTLTKTSRSRSWESDTNFRNLKASGNLLPDRPYSFSRVSGTTISGVVSGPITYSDYRYRTQYRVQQHPVIVALSDPVLDQASLYGKLVKRAKGASVNVPVFVAESRQTAAMVVARATTLVNALRMARRGNFQGMVDALHVSYREKGRKQVRRWNRRFATDGQRSLANIWLEARYGWLPFYSEVYSAFELLSELAEDQASHVRTVSAKAETRSVQNTTSLILNFVADGGLKYDAEIITREQLRVKWRFMPYELDGLGRFGLTNPLQVAWELVPFSFVADWFLPVGRYLENLDVSSRFRHLGGTVGRVRETIVKYSNPRQTFVYGGAGSFVDGFLSTFESRTLMVTRQPLGSLPIADLGRLSFEPNLNAKRVVDSIALLSQQVRRLV